MRIPTSVIVAGLITLTATPGPAQSPHGLKAGVEKYAKCETAAKEEFVRDMHRVLDRVRMAKGAKSALVDRHLKEVKAQIEAFEAKGELPTHDDLLGPTVEYLDALRKGRAEMNRVYKNETEEARRVKDDKRLDELVKAKAAFDRRVCGPALFPSDARWNGSRYSGAHTTDFHLAVGKAADGTFRGHVWQDAQSANKIEMEVEGTLDGNEIQFHKTKMLKGSVRVFALSGYVIGPRMILRLKGVSAKGLPIDGIICLYKK